MKIAILDSHPVDRGDMDWSDFRALGECMFHDRTPPPLVLERAGDCEIVLVNKVVLSRQIISALPKLRYIGVIATGTNNVDLHAARERGVVVTNVPAYSTPSVAQGTFALLLELTNHVSHHSQAVHDGQWAKIGDWCFWDKPLIELHGLTLGIVGLGRIGLAVADLGKAFGMNVLAYTNTPRPVPEFIRVVDLETLLRESDVVSLHCALTEKNRQFMDARRLALMKPTALLLNTSRGGLIDEHALAAALNEGRLAGAGLDVLSSEPPTPDNPLLTAKNCILTPHLAWATHAARERLLRIAAQNIRAFLDGKPVNVVNQF